MGKAKTVIKRIEEDAGFREMVERDFDGAVREYGLSKGERAAVREFLARKDTQSKSGLLGELKTRAGKDTQSKSGLLGELKTGKKTGRGSKSGLLGELKKGKD